MAEADALNMAATPIAAVTTNDLSEITDILNLFRFAFGLSPETPDS
ncbi:hypothetical protein [Brucella ovis]|nr:hypothetical protein [Brucella ovis]